MSDVLNVVHDKTSASGNICNALVGKRLRILTLTTLFPSEANPRHGIFVETRLRELRKSAPVDLQVVAPVPWFPFDWPIAGRYARYAAAPCQERRYGISVRHPRFLSIPGVNTAFPPVALTAALWRAAARLRDNGWSCDVIDAHYLYPDGVAAAAVARRLGRPFVVTARGSDVNFFGQRPSLQPRILTALSQAARVIAVSEALKQALVGIGASPNNVEVLRNGVDTTLFRPVSNQAAESVGASQGPLIATVGNLVPLKGHDLVLRAARHVAGAHVVVVGNGPERERLGALVGDLRMESRVRFVGDMPQANLASIYSAADVLALGSTREGWPNVLLEAMACGTPVVAMDVGGVREIVTNPDAGEVIARRNEHEFAAAIDRVLRRRAKGDRVRAHALRFSWKPIVRRLYEILATVARSPR